jgi:hypothetical protein
MKVVLKDIKCRVRLAGPGHHTFTVEITGSNPVRDTILFGVVTIAAIGPDCKSGLSE